MVGIVQRTQKLFPYFCQNCLHERRTVERTFRVALYGTARLPPNKGSSSVDVSTTGSKRRKSPGKGLSSAWYYPNLNTAFSSSLWKRSQSYCASNPNILKASNRCRMIASLGGCSMNSLGAPHQNPNSRCIPLNGWAPVVVKPQLETLARHLKTKEVDFVIKWN